MTQRSALRAGGRRETLAAVEPAPTDLDLAALYRVEKPGLMRFFRRRSANVEDAHDLVQESFSRLLAAGSGADLLKPGAYLRRIGQNLLRDRDKMSRRRSASEHVPADESTLAGSDQCQLLETRDLLDRLEHVMLELPQQTREIFMAHRLDGLTYREIADRTDLTVKQVEKRIARALLEIDRALSTR